MKKTTALSATVIFILSSFWVNTIHSYTVPRIEGGNQSLSAYSGKKILVITLPLTQNASADSMLYALDTVASAHSATLKVIAVPSYEDGYTPVQQAQLEQWYRSKLGNYILITEGLYTRKTSGAQQHALFKWMTIVAENEVFDMDVEGPGYKFFANGSGQLYGVLKSQSKMSGSSVQKTLNMQ
jgi:glutathione peroxidase-family protein